MINPYLTGNKVYRGGSNNATSGTVDPTGYVDRERRSQLAKRMLQQSNQTIAGQKQAADQARVVVPGLEYRNDIGNITPPTLPAMTNPQDASYTGEAAANYENWTQQAQALQEQRQQTIKDYTEQMNALQRQAELAPSNLNNMLASRGLSRSSAGANIAGDYAKTLQEQIAKIQSAMGTADTDYITGQGNASTAYLRAMEAAQAGLTGRMAENAGKLGIGTPGDVSDPGSSLSDAIRDEIARITGQNTPTATPPSAITPAPAPAPRPPAAPSSPQAPTGIFRTGSKGNSVRAIQEMLNRHGAKLKVDGIFGNNTYSAVKRFQQQSGIGVDGIVGRNTLAKLWG